MGFWKVRQVLVKDIRWYCISLQHGFGKEHVLYSTVPGIVQVTNQATRSQMGNMGAVIRCHHLHNPIEHQPYIGHNIIYSKNTSAFLIPFKKLAPRIRGAHFSNRTSRLILISMYSLTL